MGGKKAKIDTDRQIEKKASKSVAFSKRRKGLYSKTAQLCVLSGAQVAILATPPCPNSSKSFYSFGHSSVDSVVSAFLANQFPREDLGLGFWWDDERLARSKDSKELSDAVDSISRTLQNLKGLRSAAMANLEDMKNKNKNKELVVHGTHQVLDQSQTLNLESTCASICIHEDPLENIQGLVKNIQDDNQIVAVSDKDIVIHGTHLEFDQNQTLDFQSSYESPCIQDVSPENLEGFVSNSEQKDQIVSSSDSNNNNNNGLHGNLDEFNQELDDLDQFFDLEPNSEGVSMNYEMDDVLTMMNTSQNQNCSSNSKAVEDGSVGFQRDLEQDNLQFSDLLNEFSECLG